MTENILISAPSLDLPGGVANFYRMLEPHFGGRVTFLQKPQGKSILAKLFYSLFAQFRLICILLIHRNIRTVLLNPSLGPTAVRRDVVFAFIVTRIFHRDLAVFWHGWDVEYEKTVEKELLPSFEKTFFRAKKMFVLSSVFRKKLQEWGYRGEIVLATTCFEDELLKKIVRHPPTPSEISILFLSRVEEAKGIFIVLDTVALLRKRCPDICWKLCIAGDGDARNKSEEYAQALKLENIRFTGYIQSDEKCREFSRADLFFLPSYGEGMPCALLESMGAGLPVVTRNVGGIPDFFEQGKMGFMTDSRSPEDFADTIEAMAKERNGRDWYSEYNRNYAKAHFTASKVAAWLLKELSSEVSSVKQEG